jgi:hypothetical protein
MHIANRACWLSLVMLGVKSLGGSFIDRGGQNMMADANYTPRTTEGRWTTT